MPQKHRTLADFFDQTETTQVELAAKLGISRAHMSMLTDGKRQPGLALAVKIEKLTGVPASALLMPVRRSA